MATAVATTSSEEIVVDEGMVPTCAKCEKILIGFRYVLKEEKPYCIPCYEDVFANPCFSCKAKIGCESKVTSLSSVNHPVHVIAYLLFTVYYLLLLILSASRVTSELCTIE
jgi:hypothetical protein